MRYHALACDYDGTIATAGRLDVPTVRALERCRASGRLVILVTGRELPDLRKVCPRLDLFTRVVGENGALLYDPTTGAERALADPPPDMLVRRLGERGVAPLSVGRVIVATREPHETTVLEVVRELGLEREVIFNKGAVMILPSGINKATGLAAALAELRLSRHNVVAVGDAENDHALLGSCECGVAVANAVPSLRATADLVTARDHGAGVAELIDRLLADDLRSADAALVRHDVAFGTAADATALRLSPQRVSVLVAGDPAATSTFATGVIERVVAATYQCCIVDPGGGYSGLFDAVPIGSATHAPDDDDVRALLARPDVQCVLNLRAVPLGDRAEAFAALWPAMSELRVRTGHPHWVVLDEVDQLLAGAEAFAVLPRSPEDVAGVMCLTTQPGELSPALLRRFDLVVGFGESPAEALGVFARAVGVEAPQVPPELGPGEGLAWWWRVASAGAIAFQPLQGRAARGSPAIR
jgi:hydroxymethylpyrimidine pyrophosphatase-like HAD family hydrolase